MAVDVARAPSLLPLLEEGKPSAAEWLPRRIALGFVLLLILALPWVPFWEPDWVSFGLIFVIIGLSTNILIGYAGQVSLGHQAFVGVGAFTSAILVSRSGVTFFIAIFVAAATGAVSAFLLGLVALRLKGLYLALITMGYGAVAERVIFAIRSITGGGAGTSAPRPGGFEGERAYAYLVMAILAVVIFLDWRLMNSKAGRAILTIRENEIAAASFGINVVAYKLMAFVMSGAFAGVAGALMAHRRTQVVSVDFKFELALTFVLMTVVGGLGSRTGIFIGSMFFAIFPLWFNSLTVYVLIVGPLLLLLTLTMYPGGIGEQVRPFVDWMRGKPFSIKRHDSGIQSGGAGVRP